MIKTDWTRCLALVPLGAIVITLHATAFADSVSGGHSISALGRLEPKHGVVNVAASSTPEAILGAVLVELHVEEGDDVSKGDLLAVTDTADVMSAFVAESEAELEYAMREAEAARSNAEEACVRADVALRESQRRTRLHEQGVAGEEEAESAQGEAEARAASCSAAHTAVRSAESRIEVVRARVNRVETERQRSLIRAPTDGRILDIIARPGELIGPEGILELGNVSHMYAVAEVYETDIRHVAAGQHAEISSSVFDQPIGGTVERIRQKVEKQDETGTDPAARKDARIIEVLIALDESAAVSRLTNLQVDVVIRP